MIITRCNVNPAVACKMHIRSHTIHPTIDEKMTIKTEEEKERKKAQCTSVADTQTSTNKRSKISLTFCAFGCAKSMKSEKNKLCARIRFAAQNAAYE